MTIAAEGSSDSTTDSFGDRAPLRHTAAMPGWDVLAGRARERAELDRVLARLADRRAGGLVLVEGEAGIGKTRLCEHLLDAAREVADTAAVTCWEPDAVPPFWPWRRLLALLGEDAPVTDAAGADPLAARVALFEAVTDRLVARAAARPVVLVVDDAQWADGMSRAYLGFLAPALRDVPVVVVAGVRTGDADAARLLAQAGRYAVRLPLRGLDRDDLGPVVAAVTGAEPTATELDELHRRTAGNPLFARELAAFGLERDAVPDTVRAVLGARVERVSPACRAWLDVAAVAGDDAAFDLVAATLGLSAGDGLARLDEAVAAGVALRGDGSATAFAHPLLRSVLLDALGVARRTRLHQRVAEAFEALRANGRPVPLAALATHYAAAAGAGSAEAAVRYGVAAGDEAFAALAYEQAASSYERALRCLDLAPGAHDRADLLLRSGDALTAAGQSAAARAAYVAAAAAARAAGDAAAFTRAALAVGSGDGFEVTLFDAEQQGLLAEAIALTKDGDLALRARLVARQSVAQSLAEPTERRRAAAEEALALAREAGDAAATCDALAALCDAVAGPDDAERRVGLATELVTLATGRRDVRRELLGRRLLVVAHLERRDIVAADAEIEAYGRAADRLRAPLYDWYVPLWQAMRARMEGDAEADRRALARAEERGTAAGSENAALLVLAARWFGGIDAGEPDDALLAALPEDAVSGVAVWLLVTRAYGAAAAGRHDETRALLDRAAPGLPSIPRDSEYLPTLVQAATAAAACGHPVAGTVYDLLFPHRERFAVEGIGAHCHGSVERHLALLAAATGRSSDASAHLAAAREANAAAGAVALVAHSGAAGTPDAAPAVPGEGEFRRTGDVWSVGLGGRVAHVRDSKGMRDLAALLAVPGRAVAALDLLGDRADGADTGEVADARARAAYRDRLRDLDDELADADAANDPARAERARAERDALVAHLTSAYGLGGRARRTGDPAERARTAVTARIRDALRRIEVADAGAGAHLRRSVRTGTFCSYEPVAPVRWRL